MRGKFVGRLMPLLLLVGCASTLSGPQPVRKSLYLNKRYMKFVMDNGPSYRDVRLADGSIMHYWRSDLGNLFATAMGRDDSSPDYCELALKTDPKKIVREIYILENSMICGGVLK